MTNSSLARKPQRANMTAPTREKGRTLEVVDITERYAFVEGTHDTYEISFRGLTCSCEAGRKGLHCSHVAAAVTERARMHGYDHVMLGRTQDHAESFAALQRAKGKRARVLVASGWFIVEYGKQPPSIVRPRHADPVAAQVAADSLY